MQTAVRMIFSGPRPPYRRPSHPQHVRTLPTLAFRPCFPAGVATIAPILEATVKDWDWTMNVRSADRR